MPERLPYRLPERLPFRLLTGPDADDPLLRGPAAARALAAAVPGARGIVLPGTGYDLSVPHWPAIIDYITQIAARAEGSWLAQRDTGSSWG
ncbi:MAG TPA: hypothetical protein VF062_26455 [Candidatus Limnocylindrales bacterium]